MQIRKLLGSRAPRALLLPSGEVPHAVLEPNLTCDLHCPGCYRTARSLVKPLAVIEAEIDRLLALRRLETISILGGEPTLHPELPEIVRLVKQRGLTCQVLTNGVRLHGDHSNALLDALIAAGLDRIVWHVDRGQERECPPDELLLALLQRCESRRLPNAISVTIDPANSGTLGVILQHYASFQYFDGVLATLRLDPWAVARREPPPLDAPTLEAEYRGLRESLGILPSAYVPSSLAPERATWLIYFYFSDTRTGTCFAISPRVDHVLRRALRLRHGRYVFGAPLRPQSFLPALLGLGALETALAPSRGRELFNLLRKSRVKGLRFRYVVIQSGPEFDSERGDVHICHSCPDATLREGMLVPTCLADVVAPLGADQSTAPWLRAAVLKHLGASP